MARRGWHGSIKFMKQNEWENLKGNQFPKKECVACVVFCQKCGREITEIIFAHESFSELCRYCLENIIIQDKFNEEKGERHQFKEPEE